MFGRSPAIVLDSYSRRRSPRRVPRWLLLLLTGAALGAAAVIGVQQRLLPPRLSADASSRLTTAFEAADRERKELRVQLDATARQLQGATAEVTSLKTQAVDRQRTVKRLEGDVATLLDALPPDPRGGTVQVRAAQFKVEGGQLTWDIVLSRARADDTPWKGVLQLVLRGAASRSLKLEPEPLSLVRHNSTHGRQPLPAGFQPDQVTVQVLDRPNGRPLGMRVWNLR
jgi:hypothetical protein